MYTPIFRKIFIVAFLIVITTNIAHAEFVSGGIYRVHNPQVNPITGTFSNATYTTFSGGRPISGIISGGGYQMQQGTPYNFTDVAPTGGGGSSGGSIVLDISNVSTTLLTCESATIIFSTNRSAYSTLTYDTGDNDYTFPLTTNLSTSHAVTLSSLDENTRYTYSLFAVDAFGREDTENFYSFTTPSCDDVVVPPSSEEDDNDIEPGTGTDVIFDDGEVAEVFYGIELEVLPPYKNISDQDVVVAKIIITDLTFNPDYDKVSIVYNIYDSETGELVYTEGEERIIGMSSTYNKTFILPKNIHLGKYDIVASIDYDSGYAESNDGFSISVPTGQMCQIGTVNYLWWLIIYVLLLIIDSLLWRARDRGGKVEPEDLKIYLKK